MTGELRRPTAADYAAILAECGPPRELMTPPVGSNKDAMRFTSEALAVLYVNFPREFDSFATDHPGLVINQHERQLREVYADACQALFARGFLERTYPRFRWQDEHKSHPRHSRTATGKAAIAVMEGWLFQADVSKALKSFEWELGRHPGALAPALKLGALLVRSIGEDLGVTRDPRWRVEPWR